jgi:hypothetical protein
MPTYHHMFNMCLTKIHLLHLAPMISYVTFKLIELGQGRTESRSFPGTLAAVPCASVSRLRLAIRKISEELCDLRDMRGTSHDSSGARMRN